jgi:hypothetical protein
MDRLIQDPIMDHNGSEANPEMTLMGLGQFIQMGKMLTETFQRFDELTGNFGQGNVNTERGHGSGDYIDGEYNAIDEEFLDLDPWLKVDYENATSDMFQEV